MECFLTTSTDCLVWSMGSPKLVKSTCNDSSILSSMSECLNNIIFLNKTADKDDKYSYRMNH